MSGVTNKPACSPPVLGHDHAMEVFWNLNQNDLLTVQLLSAPDRTIFACLKQHCVETGEDVVSVIVDTSMVPAINGTPGTKCSTFRTKNLNGLCTLRRGYRRKSLGGLVDGFTNFLKSTGKVFKKAAKAVTTTVIAKVNEKLKQAGENAINHLKDIPKNMIKDHSRKIFIAGGATVGGSVGATIGSAFPIVGTTAGGIAGTFVGEFIGGEIHSRISTEVDKMK